MQVVRTETEIARVENWAVEGIDESTHYPGMSYEQGIVDVLAWLRGDNDTAQDDEYLHANRPHAGPSPGRGVSGLTSSRGMI